MMECHYLNHPGSAQDSSNLSNGFDGPEGLLLDSINWAGSGTGIGFFSDASFPSEAYSHSC